jgi:metallo-beta-lactamase family protein
MDLAFHGAAGGVTGSCYLLTARGKRVLIDCGLFQGADAGKTAQGVKAGHGGFGFDPTSIDYVLLTHAHLDHCGRLPLLTKFGFRGEILATAATRELARLVLLDAAGLQVEEAKRQARHLARRGASSVTTGAAPTFDEVDVLDAMDHFGRVASYRQPLTLCDGVTVTFGNAGHILGSAWVLVDVEDQSEDRSHGEPGERGSHTRLLFSGDLGTGSSAILDPPDPAPEVDVVVMESTYGDRLHQPIGSSVQELCAAVRETLDRGGNVVIPTFALERAQDILYSLRELTEQGELPRRLTAYLDSPMAISATALFRRHPEAISDQLRTLLARGVDPFHLPGLHLTRSTADSMAINQVESGAVILAGSGMATGGRVLHHLRHNLWRPESSIIFVGYAASGTLARQIIDGQREVRVFDEPIHVAAHIYTIGGFSAHADRDGLLAWYRTAGAPANTFLIHGEDPARESLAAVLRSQGHAVTLPALYANYSV